MTDEPHRTIKIWQQNTRKSLNAQLLTIHAAEVFTVPHRFLQES